MSSIISKREAYKNIVASFDDPEYRMRYINEPELFERDIRALDRYDGELTEDEELRIRGYREYVWGSVRLETPRETFRKAWNGEIDAAINLERRVAYRHQKDRPIRIPKSLYLENMLENFQNGRYQDDPIFFVIALGILDECIGTLTDQEKQQITDMRNIVKFHYYDSLMEQLEEIIQLKNTRWKNWRERTKDWEK